MKCCPFRTFPLAILAMFLFANRTIAELTEEKNREAIGVRERIFPGSKRLDKVVWENLPPSQKELVVTYLRDAVERQMRRATSEWDWFSGEAVDLAALGDELGREIMVKEYWRDPSSMSIILRRINDPKMIPRIGEELFKNEPFDSIVGDMIVPGTQVVAFEDVLSLLQSTNSFNREVSDWAARFRGLRGEGENLNLVRNWYGANEAALQVGDFRAVKPGVNPIVVPAPALTPSDLQPARTANGAPQRGVELTSGYSANVSNHRFSIWLGLAGIFIAIGLVIFVLRKK